MLIAEDAYHREVTVSIKLLMSSSSSNSSSSAVRRKIDDARRASCLQTQANNVVEQMLQAGVSSVAKSILEQSSDKQRLTGNSKRAEE
jgi:hypothetical protein